MRTWLFTVLVPLLVLLPTPAAATPTVPSDLRLSTPWSVGPKLDKYESWPDAVTAANGWVVMAHSSGDAHVPKIDRRTVVRVSKDKGVTWQVARVFNSTNLNGFEGIHRPSGRILIMLSDLFHHDDFNWVQTWKSDDNGLTWQALSKRYAWTDPWSFGNLERVTCDGGKLVIAWNNDTAWGIATSRDNGVTWSRSYNTAQHQLFEGRIVQLSGDRLVMIGRDAERGPILFKSPDCGKTWTSASTGIGGRLSEGAVKHGDIWRMVTINRTNFRMEVRDASLTELYSDPTAWSAPKLLRTLRPAGPVDLGYPTILSVSRSYDLVIWYGPTKIVKQPMIYAAHLPWRAP